MQYTSGSIRNGESASRIAHLMWPLSVAIREHQFIIMTCVCRGGSLSCLCSVRAAGSACYLTHTRTHVVATCYRRGHDSQTRSHKHVPHELSAAEARTRPCCHETCMCVCVCVCVCTSCALQYAAATQPGTPEVGKTRYHSKPLQVRYSTSGPSFYGCLDLYASIAARVFHAMT
jgi:hypothetical protein